MLHLQVNTHLTQNCTFGHSGFSCGGLHIDTGMGDVYIASFYAIIISQQTALDYRLTSN